MKSHIRDQTAIVIPAYNEASTIADVAARACQYANHVIVVDDGSNDATLAVLENIPVTVLKNPVNLGKGKSLIIGAKCALANGAISIITLDGDGQHRPEDVPLLLERARLNPRSIVIAARLNNRDVAPRVRRSANRFADFWISWAAGQPIRDSQSGFRLYPSSVFTTCATNNGGFVFESEILIAAARTGFGVTNVPIDTIYYRNARPSHYRPAADTLAIVKMVAWQLLSRGLYLPGLLRCLRPVGTSENVFSENIHSDS